MEIEFDAGVFIGKYMRLEDVASGRSKPMVTTADMTGSGFTRIGTAKVTATLFSKDAVVQSQISGLQRELAQERAASQKRQNFILDQISKLQALTFEPA